jgi:adenylate/nucleoside-diphosphate kinase
LNELLLNFFSKFRSRGFVLDGFPSNETESSYLTEKGFFPDAIIILKVNEQAIIDRLLKKRLERWQIKQAEKREKKAQKLLKKKEKLVIMNKFVLK